MNSFIKNRFGPILQPATFKDTKDPCPVFDGTKWHLYGSGGESGREVWSILHATADNLNGPWSEEKPVILDGVTGDHVAAPGVITDPDEQLFHMFVQKDFLAVGGTIEHLTSVDGHYFKRLDTPIKPLPNSREAGIYDPHPAQIGKDKYMVYAAADSIFFNGRYFVGRPEIYLAKSESGSWYGPWLRLGRILGHEGVAAHHNQPDDPDYEWGLEGPQLIELPNGKILLSAVCFLPGLSRGSRQRVFFAIADTVTGPYLSLGPILDSQDNDWESGENGHATGVIFDQELFLFYQGRSQSSFWRYGIAQVDLNVLNQSIITGVPPRTESLPVTI